MSNMPDKPSRPAPPQPPNRFSRSLLGWILIVSLGLVLMVFINRRDDHRPISVNEFWTYVQSDQLTDKLIIRDDRIDGENTPTTQGIPQDKPRKFSVVYPSRDRSLNFEDKLLAALAKNKNQVKVTYEPEAWWEGGILANLLILVAGFLLIWFLVFRRLGRRSGRGRPPGRFGRSRHRVSNKENPRVTFNDVAGIDDAKEEVARDHRVPQEPAKFQRLGGRDAREACCWWASPAAARPCWPRPSPARPRCPSSASPARDFVEMFVGVGAAACATSSSRPRTPPRASSFWTRSTPSGGAGQRPHGAAETKWPRPSTRSWWRWTGSTLPTRSSSSRRPTARTCWTRP